MDEGPPPPERDTALAALERACERAPYAAALHARRALALRAAGHMQDAADAWGRVAALRPAASAAQFDHGLALHLAGQPAAALAAYDRTVSLEPGHVGAWSNRGLVLLQLNRPTEALRSFDAAVAIDPGVAVSHANRGLALRELNRPREAIASLDRALALQPRSLEATLNRAVSQLLLGQLPEGFAGHEFRWAIEPLRSQRRSFAQPLWLGREDIAGRRLLLHAEQGFGDTVNFCRYARIAAKRGARVVLEVQRSLVPLMRSLAGVETLVAQGEPLPDFDLHTPLMSAPLAFGTTLETIPAEPSYLAAPEDRVAHWAERLGPKTRPRVGVVWFGKPTHSNDHNRSIPFELFARALPGGIEAISLQERTREVDAAAQAAHPGLRRFEGEIADFGDTAALASLVDLVIAVDTSVAHVAAALGRPTWILTPFAPDWRWLQDREDSPWYPSARLLRQPALHDWDSVLARVRRELEIWTPA